MEVLGDCTFYVKGMLNTIMMVDGKHAFMDNCDRQVM
jgi:hypothetical protein